MDRTRKRLTCLFAIVVWGPLFAWVLSPMIWPNAPWARGNRTAWWVLWSIAMVAGAVFDVVLYRWYVRKVERLVREHEGRVCTNCLYPLVIDAPQGEVPRCPECGEIMSPEQARREWVSARAISM